MSMKQGLKLIAPPLEAGREFGFVLNGLESTSSTWKRTKIETDEYVSSAIEYKRCLILLSEHQICEYVLWRYGLWSFQMGGTKLELFLPKNQHPQRKLLNFENWCNGELSKSAKI